MVKEGGRHTVARIKQQEVASVGIFLALGGGNEVELGFASKPTQEQLKVMSAQLQIMRAVAPTEPQQPTQANPESSAPESPGNLAHPSNRWSRRERRLCLLGSHASHWPFLVQRFCLLDVADRVLMDRFHRPMSVLPAYAAGRLNISAKSRFSVCLAALAKFGLLVVAARAEDHLELLAGA